MFKNKLKVQFEFKTDEVKIYSLKEELHYKSDKYDYTVPKLFKTDFASVPLSLQFIYPPQGKWSRASVLHDYLYSKERKDVTRFKADKVFLEAMEKDGVSWITRHLFFAGVRAFGGYYKRGIRVFK